MRRLHSFFLVCAGFLLSGAAWASEPPPTIGLDEIEPGQHGYGLSVFTANEPERFEVEVLGIMRNVMPDTSYILARLEGHGLEETGVIAGMSGSPVYLDDRLAGAVAFSWPFATEAIAGITPIETMRRLRESSPSEGVLLSQGPPVALADLVARRLPTDLLYQGLQRLQPRLAGGGVLGTQWVLRGFGGAGRELLQESLQAAVPAGQAPAELPSDLRPGSPVAASLVDGDFQLAVTGTVTERTGDKVLALGHPFLGIGPVRLPMATAEVLTVVGSRFNSFKVTNLGRVVGAFDEDRQAGVHGRLGIEAPTVPLAVRVRSAETREYRMQLANLPQFIGALAAISALGSLDTASYAFGSQGLDMNARLQLGEHGDLEIRQSFDGENAGLEAAIYLFAFSGFVAQNPFERVEIEAIDVDLVQYPERRTARLVDAHAERAVVRPGESLTLYLQLVSLDGERFRWSVDVEIPEELPAGRYSLLVGDGTSVDAARLLVEPPAPVNFRQALELLQSLHSRSELLVLGIFKDRGLLVAGEVLPRLPGSVSSVWEAAGNVRRLPLAVAYSHRQDARVPVDGIVKLNLEVRRRSAQAAPEETEEEPAQPPEATVPTATSDESDSTKEGS